MMTLREGRLGKDLVDEGRADRPAIRLSPAAGDAGGGDAVFRRAREERRKFGAQGAGRVP
jgi:hypothetical protein